MPNTPPTPPLAPNQKFGCWCIVIVIVMLLWLNSRSKPVDWEQERKAWENWKSKSADSNDWKPHPAIQEWEQRVKRDAEKMPGGLWNDPNDGVLYKRDKSGR
jgi:hypothetical protein